MFQQARLERREEADSYPTLPILKKTMSGLK